MNKTEYLQLKLNKLKQYYNNLIGILNKQPKKYDFLKRNNCFPKRIHAKCPCGNDKFYYDGYYICSQCFTEFCTDAWDGWEPISPEEKIMYYGIEIKAEEE